MTFETGFTEELCRYTAAGLIAFLFSWRVFLHHCQLCPTASAGSRAINTQQTFVNGKIVA